MAQLTPVQTTFTLVSNDSSYRTEGACNVQFVNRGTLNVTLNKLLVIVPGASVNLGPGGNYADFTSYQIQFALGEGRKELVIITSHPIS